MNLLIFMQKYAIHLELGNEVAYFTGQFLIKEKAV